MRLGRARRAVLMAGVIGVAAVGGAAPARAWWRAGVWVAGPPVVIAPPPVVVAPPPVYAYPPPAYYAPPPPPPPPAPQAPAPQAEAAPPQQQSQPAPVVYGATCYAGVYVCPAPGYTPVGSTCSCPGLGAPSYGTVY